MNPHHDNAQDRRRRLVLTVHTRLLLMVALPLAAKP